MSENLEQPEVTDDLDAFTAEFFGRNSEEPEAEASTNADTEGEAEEVEEGAEPETAEAEQDQEEPGEETESQDQEEEDEEEEQPETPQPKGKPTVQERINELVRQREEAKREGEAKLEALRREFEEKLQALESKGPAKPEPKEAGEPTPDDLNEDGTLKYELGEFDPQYIRDLTKYTLNQERQALEAQAAEQAQQREAEAARVAMVTTWNEKVEEAQTNYPDFMEKGQELLGGFDNLESGYAQYLSELLMSMDKGPDVLYYLANNPNEAKQIVNSGAQKATLALGRIEAKFIEDAARKTLQKPRHSKAPPPPPAQARARGANGAFVSVAPDTDDLDAFQKEFFAKK